MEDLDKGERNEELLRCYFIQNGYYAVRGVPFIHARTDVTDVDIWLYSRSSMVFRERSIIDAKTRRKPNAFERVLWAKGLQQILGVDHAIVATTDRREVVADFGRKHDVAILDGGFLSRLAAEPASDRLNEESFIDLVLGQREDRLLGQWRARYVDSKSLLLTSLEFDGCNKWIEEIRYFAHQVLTSSQPQGACRLAYVLISYLLVGLDYSLRLFALETTEARRRALEEGLRHGSEGRAGIARTLNVSARLIETYLPDARSLGAQLRNTVMGDLSKMPIEAIVEYLGRGDIQRDFFAMACAYEALGYAKQFTAPASLQPQLQGPLAILLDYFGIERPRFYATL